MKKLYAIVTGSSSGLGLQMAESLLERDYIVFGGSRTESVIDHPNFIDIELDIRSELAVEAFIDRVLEVTDKIDLIVNNAGICEFRDVTATDTRAITDHLQTNAMGSFYLMKYGEALFDSARTHIINIMSTFAHRGYPQSVAYTMAEHAKEGLFKALRSEWKDAHYRITNMYIGPVVSPLWEAMPDNTPWDKMLDIDEFMYMFDTIVDAPPRIQFPNITFMHKDT